MGLADLLQPVDPAARVERSPDDVLRRRNRWSVLFTLLVAVGGLLAVLFLPQDDLAAARERWEEREPTAYEWTYSVLPGIGDDGRVTVAVRDGRITASGGEPADSGGRPMTVDDVFDAMATSGVREVRYAADLGYPADLQLDAGPDDASWGLQVHTFLVIED